MTAQLVLQFATASSPELKRLLLFEELLRECLGGSAVVDGHDFGGGEFNIFIWTDEPESTLQRVLEVAQTRALSTELCAGYRTAEQEEISPLWPPGLSSIELK